MLPTTQAPKQETSPTITLRYHRGQWWTFWEIKINNTRTATGTAEDPGYEHFYYCTPRGLT